MNKPTNLEIQMRQFTQEILDKTRCEISTGDWMLYTTFLSPKHSQETLLSVILRFYTLKINLLWLNRL